MISLPYMSLNKFYQCFRKRKGKGGYNLEKEKEDCIWRRKIYIFFAEKKKNVEGKIGKYLEKEVKKN